MRHIATPETGKPALEDVQISYWEHDGKGNVAVRREIVEIPANTSRWVKEAMVLGFLTYFDGIIESEDSPERAERKAKAEKALGEFKELYAKIKKQVGTESSNVTPINQPEATQ